MKQADGWGTRRIWIAGALGAMLAGSDRILDFWSLGAGGSLQLAVRGLLDLSRLFFLLPLAGFVVGLLIAAAIALWRRRFRRMASSILAIAAMPVCFVIVAKVALFDPWVWYAMANSTRFAALAVSDPPPNGPKYAEIEVRDVSTGFAGIGPNHFIALIYDESDAVGLEPSQRPSIWRTRTEYFQGRHIRIAPRLTQNSKGATEQVARTERSEIREQLCGFTAEPGLRFAQSGLHSLSRNDSDGRTGRRRLDERRSLWQTGCSKIQYSDFDSYDCRHNSRSRPGVFFS